MIHRVDGPIGVYRGQDDGTDTKLFQINRDLADATIFQSNYSYHRYLDMGMKFSNPHVIHNAADHSIFGAVGRLRFSTDRKTRLISTSWSDNPRKGGDIYRWIAQNIDPARYEYTFVGRSDVELENMSNYDPVPSGRLAELLRTHDIFVTASRNESCSNAVIEALSCGLPVIYIKSGSNHELVGEAGLGFEQKEEVPALLDRLVEEHELRQENISTLSIQDVAKQYLSVLKKE